MITVAGAETYFSKHLQKSKWEAKTYDEKEAALLMAVDDITIRLKLTEIDETEDYQVKACYEQALFLLDHIDKLVTPEFASSESSSGHGSANYRDPKEHDIGLAPRAKMFISKLKRGPVRIVR